MKLIVIATGGILLGGLAGSRANESGAERVLAARSTTVTLDIRPGCPTNWVELGSSLEIQVAIRGSAAFDVTLVDVSSLSFAGAFATSATITDLNGDGIHDLVSSYPMSDLDLDSLSTSAELTGADVFGSPFSGTDAVTIVVSSDPVVTVIDDGSGYSVTLANGHGLATFSLSDCILSVQDRCGNSISINASGQILRITSDEVSKGKKTAQRDPDMIILSSSSFSVRQQRNGGGDGRVYTVHFQVTDASGGATISSFRLQVPSSPSGSAAVDSGVADCVGACP